MGALQKCFPYAVLAAFLAAGCSSTTSIPDYQTTLLCPRCQTIPVARVIDGDTFDTPAGRVRLFGIDAPERGKPCYKQAARWLGRLAGNTVRVEQGPRAQGPGGRLLYYVYTKAGRSIDEILIREGLAVAWTRDGQHRDLLVGLEAEARKERAGCLW